MRTSLYVIVGSFLCGVLVRSYIEVDVYSLAALILGAASLAFAARLQRVPAFGYGVLMLVCIVLGVIRIEVAEQSFANGLLYDDGAVVHVVATIVEEPDVRDTYVWLTVQFDDSETRARVRTGLYPVYEYGDRVDILGTLAVPRTFTGDSERVFDYPNYLKSHHVHYVFDRALVAETEDRVWSTTGTLLSLKSAWLASVAILIPEPNASLLGGVVVGAKRSIGDEWLEKFRDTGIVHIIVLSGYNLTIVALFVVWLTSRLPRSARFVCGVLGIVAFALMVGGGPTVVRASVMAVIGMLALLVDRPYNLLRALAIAAALMVVWNPFVLAFDPGFQLSFVATLGLVLGAPIVERWVSFVPTWGELRTIVAATLATQVSVLPLLLYQVGAVSLVAPLVNVLVVPIVPIVMAVGFAAGLVGMVSAFVALPLAFLANGLLHYIFVVVDVAASVPFASIDLPQVPVVVLVSTYAVLGLYVWRMHTSPGKPGLVVSVDQKR